MSDEFWVDTARLREAAPLFDTLTEQIGKARSALTGRLDAEGACWGADESGAAFAQNYVPGVEVGLDNVAKMSQVLTWIATTIRASADSLQGADDLLRDGFGKIDGHR